MFNFIYELPKLCLMQTKIYNLAKKVTYEIPFPCVTFYFKNLCFKTFKVWDYEMKK